MFEFIETNDVSDVCEIIKLLKRIIQICFYFVFIFILILHYETIINIIVYLT